jgi:hypothetical protein
MPTCGNIAPATEPMPTGQIKGVNMNPHARKALDECYRILGTNSATYGQKARPTSAVFSA